MQCSDTGVIYFDDVRVPAKYLIGEEGRCGGNNPKIKFEHFQVWDSPTRCFSSKRKGATHTSFGKNFTKLYFRMAAAAITLSGMTLCIDQTIAYTRYMQLLLTLLYILIKGRGRYLVPLSWITSTVTSAWPNSSLRLVKTLIQY